MKPIEIEKSEGYLTAQDYDILIPAVVKVFKRKGITKKKPINNYQIRTRLKRAGIHGVTGWKLRLAIHHIRVNKLVKGLLASKDGYFKTRSPRHMDEYINSLAGRIRSIKKVERSFKEQLYKIRYGV